MHRLGVDTSVAITGIGIISSLGVSTSECWEKLLAGHSGIRPITKFNVTNNHSKIGGELPDQYFDLEKRSISKRHFKQTVLSSRIIRIAAKEALDDAKFYLDAADPYRCGVVIGTTGSSVRGPANIENSINARFTIIREMTNAAPSWISIDNGFKGPSFSVSASCASGSQAIATSFDLISGGILDIAITGGTDSLLTENNVRRGNLAGVLSKRNNPSEKAMRPFDKSRDGFVLADGGCSLILESYQHAVKRNAKVYAWIRGYSSYYSKPTNLLTNQSSADDMAQTIKLAICHAGISPNQIGYISAHGIATPAGDFNETEAIKKAFGQCAYDLKISSQKSMTGHTFGASSAIEVATSALTLNTQNIPPTINLATPDPECNLNYVPNSMIKENHLDAAISNTFAFGGHNCVIVLTRNV